MHYCFRYSQQAISFVYMQGRYRDQTGEVIELKSTVQRIVSLVPSQSEFLWDLGLEHELVGITKFCIYPATMFKSITRVGGTKQINLELIAQLQPDLIIGNKEENTREDIQALRQNYPVWLSDINTIGDAMEMMHQLAVMTNRLPQWAPLKARIEESVKRTHHLFQGRKVAYAIWHEPWMFVGHSTYINAVLNHLGMENVLSSLARYPQLPIEALKRYAPDVILLSEEPFPFKANHAAAVKAHFPNTKVLCFSGEPFSWYGSRMQFLEQEMLHLQRLMC